MKVLVLGNLEQARALLEPESKDARTVFHCRKDIRVTRSFSPIDPPDWILIEEKVMPGKGIPLLQSLLAMDFYNQPDPACATCRLERDQRGQVRLHCGLRQQQHTPSPAKRSEDPLQGEAAICFEYQAPLRRTGN
ncbi:MAG TPA: hypothetical protein VIQ75_04095 [Gammaproteobacteria bacterium]